MAIRDTSGGLVPPPGDGDYIDPNTGMRVTSTSGAKETGSNLGPTEPGVQPSGTTPPGTNPLYDGPASDLTAYLTNAGYDPSRSSSIADMLLQNAANNPTIGMPNVSGVQAGRASVGSASTPTPIAQQTFGGLMGYGTGIGIGNTTATTREVQDNELVEGHLEGLLSGDSPYIRNARLRAAELANSRGQFGSSFMAGAAERAAIEAGLPIATADAQAYRDAATQNLNALNNFALANLQRATALDQSLLDANTNISIANMDTATRVNLANLDALTRTNIANLDADTQARIANLSSQTQMAMQRSQNDLAVMLQGRELTHQTGIEQLRQQGNMDLAQVDADLRMRLEQFAQDGRIDLQNLSHEQQLIVNEEINNYNREREAQNNAYTRRENMTSAATQAQMNYINYVTAYKDVKMDANAAKRLQEDAWNHLVAELDMINGLYPEFPPITPKRG